MQSRCQIPFVAVDCLSRYLRVEPMKTKYATEAAQAFKKMIKNKQPLKVWVDDGKEFLGAFKSLCEKRGIHLYTTYSKKKSAFVERNNSSLKNIIYRYLEEKWTDSYIDKLDQFVKTINSRVTGSLNLPQIRLPERYTEVGLTECSNKYPSKTQVLYRRLC